MATTKTLHIRSVNSLAPLREGNRRGRLRRFRKIVLEVRELSAEENQSWQRRIERLYFSCGCVEGAITSMAAVLVYVVWLFVRPGGIGALSWMDAVWGALVFILTTGLGKALGLENSRRRLSEAISQLDRVLREKGATAPETTLPEEPQERAPCAVT